MPEELWAEVVKARVEGLAARAAPRSSPARSKDNDMAPSAASRFAPQHPDRRDGGQAVTLHHGTHSPGVDDTVARRRHDPASTVLIDPLRKIVETESYVRKPLR